MNCREIEEMQIIERYLQEQLSSEKAAAFEEHYFECDECFSELKLRDSVARALLSEKSEEKDTKAARWTRQWTRCKKSLNLLTVAAQSQ